MPLPESLARAVAEEVARVPPAVLASAVADLTKSYKEQRSAARAFATDAHRAAYLTVRLPATYAAIRRVLLEARDLAPQVEITSLLDLGAGPGTALWATTDAFPALHQATLVERDEGLRSLGQRLQAGLTVATSWRAEDIAQFVPGQADLVTISYVLGELAAPAQRSVVGAAWQSARKLLVIIEPGTPRGFANLLKAREQVTAAGGYSLAPCPRAEAHACPMQANDDWCHFAVRVERTGLHRRVKGGDLGHEDEKFCYFVASHEPLTTARSRVVRHPQQHGGHVQLTLCTSAGIQQRAVTRSNKTLYRAARKASWGDAWPES